MKNPVKANPPKTSRELMKSLSILKNLASTGPVLVRRKPVPMVPGNICPTCGCLLPEANAKS
jgi:hypothetical protein